MHPNYRMLADVVKRAVRARKLTYIELATMLDLSERTIKRILNLEQEDFSRLLQIADALGLTLQNLVEMASEARDQVFRLTEEQETELSTNPVAWALFYEVQRGSQLDEIARRFGLEKVTVDRSLRLLEKMTLLERIPGGQVRLRHKGELSLLLGGPLQKMVFIERYAEFTGSIVRNLVKAATQGAHINMSDHWVTQNTLEKFSLKLRGLFKDFRQAAFYDKETFPQELLKPCRWLSALAENQSIAEEILEEYSERKRNAER